MENDYLDNTELNNAQINGKNLENTESDTEKPDNSKLNFDQLEENQLENNQLDNAYLNTEEKNLKENDENKNNSNLGKSSNTDDELKITDTNKETANNEKITKDKSKITVNNKSVVKERNLILHLLDSNKKGIENKKITIKIGKKTYTKTTNKKGKVSLKISLATGKYTVKLKFAGDKYYTKSNKTFEMKVYKIKTHFTAKYTSIIRGQYFYAYLKDKDGKALASKSVIININKKNYYRKTNKNGKIRLKISLKRGKYKTKLIYKGSKTYQKTLKKLTIKAHNTRTFITIYNRYVVKNKSLQIRLKYGKSNKDLANKKLFITIKNKVYKRTTNKNGKAFLKLTKPIGKYKIKIRFKGSKGFLKSDLTRRIQIIKDHNPPYAKTNKTISRKYEKTLKYYIKITDKKGNPLSGKNVTVKVKCNNFTSGSGIKITKKTIVLSSDNIETKSKDKKRLREMAKLLRAKGYKVILSGIGPNYHVSDVKKYKNVCVFSLVGGIDSGMFVDMAQPYYQSYLKKNKNQFVLGCVDPPKGINLANRTWLVRAHDDNYSPKKFKGLYFPGKYLNKRTHVDYVYGSTPKQLVNNFLKYARKGKSIGIHNTLPGKYKTYKLTTSKKGYVHIDLPIGNHTVIYSYVNGKTTVTIKNWVNIVK